MDDIVSIIVGEPAPVVFVALLKSLYDLGYVVEFMSKSDGLLQFRSGVSLISWRGQEMTARLVEKSETKTELRISAAFRERYAILYGLDWGEAKRISRKIVGKTLQYLVTGSISAFEIVQPLWTCSQCGTMNAFWLSNCVKCGRKS